MIKKIFLVIKPSSLLQENRIISLSFHQRAVKMMSQILMPHPSVKGMKTLNKEAFTKKITICSLVVNTKNFSQVSKVLKKYLLKLRKFNPVLAHDENRQILLNPELIKSEIEAYSIIKHLSPLEAVTEMKEIVINYDNWTKDQIFQSVLPDDADGCSGFSSVGHILHLNLKDHLLPYKHLIGQVLLDKIENISIVVNKTNTIDDSDNTFRSFSMEVLAGEGDLIANVKENNCSFMLDFSKVYWNPRLGMEHSRIISKLSNGDVLFDAMAGIGPFSIPAAKRKCRVFANDLNPASFEYLQKNCSLNKVDSYVKCFNIDGREFIRTIFKSEYLNILKNPYFSGKIHITMNLPSIAVTFLSSFCGLLTSDDILQSNFDALVHENDGLLPIIHVYFFSRDESNEIAEHTVASQFGFTEEESLSHFNCDTKNSEESFSISPIFKGHIIEVINVRRVAPAKVMMRVSFRLPGDIIFNQESLPPTKRLKTCSES